TTTTTITRSSTSTGARNSACAAGLLRCGTSWVTIPPFPDSTTATRPGASRLSTCTATSAGSRWVSSTSATTRLSTVTMRWRATRWSRSAYEVSLLLVRGHAGRQLAPVRRGRGHPAQARVHVVPAALHHLRARPVRSVDGQEALGQARGFQPRQVARQAPHRRQQAAHQREADA